MMTDEQIKTRDVGRDIGAEQLASVQELKAGKGLRKTTFEPLADGGVRRTVLRADSTLEKQEVRGPQWQLMAARAQSDLLQSEFSRATGVSVRTLQEWEHGRKVPSWATQSLLKLISRHPELLAELASYRRQTSLLAALKTSVLPCVVAGVAWKLNFQVGFPDLDAAGQARLGIQAPGVVELVVFLVVGFLERGAALAHMHRQVALAG